MAESSFTGERPLRMVSATEAEACAACAEHIARLLETILENEPAATLAVSGGRTPAAMFDRLATAEIDWSRVHLFWVDERPVPPEDPQSNYGMALEHLIRPAGIPEPNVHRILGEMRPHEAARRYAHELGAYFGTGKQSLPRFDIIQLGVGADGHTASLFPGEALIDDRVDSAAAVYLQPAGQWRVTLLPGVLLAARHLAVLACGAEKADALARIWEGDADVAGCPAQILTREGRSAEWFLDLAAAAKLNPLC